MTLRTWRITHTDGTWEDVAGYSLRLYENTLTIERGHSSYNRDPKSWPLASIRSWEEVR